MKRLCHGPLTFSGTHQLGPLLLRQLAGLLQSLALAGQRHLQRRVVVGNLDGARCSYLIADVAKRVDVEAEHRGHPARMPFGRLLHDPATNLNEPQDVGDGEDAGR